MQKRVQTNIDVNAPSKVKDYMELVKFRLNITVVFSAVMAYLIASTGAINWFEIIILALGGFFITGAANALNQVLEADFDARISF